MAFLPIQADCRERLSVRRLRRPLHKRAPLKEIQCDCPAPSERTRLPRTEPFLPGRQGMQERDRPLDWRMRYYVWKRREAFRLLFRARPAAAYRHMRTA